MLKYTNSKMIQYLDSDVFYQINFLNTIENIVAKLLKDMITNKRLTISIVYNTGCIFAYKNVVFRQIEYNNVRNGHRFAIILYVLSEIHRMLLTNNSSLLRELYYRNVELVKHQNYLNAAVRDVCIIFRTFPDLLGIQRSRKGLMTGPLQIFMINGDIIDYSQNEKGILLPSTVTNIHHLETKATFVLLVEKNTIFNKLTWENFKLNQINMIVITAKGYPDLNTRLLIQRLHNECRLPIYVLVDADPYGIDIMLTYRYGSLAMTHIRNQLACLDLLWIGIHPSELTKINIRSIPLNDWDKKKIGQIKNRRHIKRAIRTELNIMEKTQKKIELDELLSKDFLEYYVKTKIYRNLAI